MTSLSSTPIVPTEGELYVPSHIDFTAELPPYRAIQSSMIEELRPDAGGDNTGPFVFRITKDPGRYMQTSFMKIGGKMRVTKKGGSPIDDTCKVCPIEFFGQAWIKKVEIYANKKLINMGSECNYHTKTLINTLLNYDTTATEAHLRCGGFAPEEVPAAATAPLHAEWNDIGAWKGLKKNLERFKKSKWVEFSSGKLLKFLFYVTYIKLTALYYFYTTF